MPDKFAKMHSTLQDVPLAKTRVAPQAQRELRPARVDYLASEFDPEHFGYPVVNKRDSTFWIIDGQHRIEAVKVFLGDAWESQSVTCRVYSGLSESEEAEMFDRLNDFLSVRAFDKFKVRVTAGRAIECAVKSAVEKIGLKIAHDKDEGSVSAVTTLVRIYERSNAPTLQRALKITHQSFGKVGLTNHVIDGIARMCERYNGELKDADAIERLRTVRGGLGTLATRAALLRKQVGASVPECFAAATVDTLNAKRGGKKLPSWWKE